MDRLRQMFASDTAHDAAYEPLEGGSEGPDGQPIDGADHGVFSWAEYSVFVLLGVAMLWAWNMFLAAAPYFQRRFEHSDVLLRNFQPAIMSVSTVGNLGSMLVLTKMQARANYPRRTAVALLLNVAIFTLLALSTKLFVHVAAGVYFAFLMLMVASASLATGLLQNGVFAHVVGYGRGEYTQGIMAGQGIAGVLPCVAQIVSVLSVPPKQDSAAGTGAPKQSSTSAFAYFLTASVISAAALVAFFHLVSSPRTRTRPHRTVASPSAPPERKPVPLTRLARKLSWPASTLFLTFTLTMFFPVLTTQIVSVRDSPPAPRLFAPASFIPLAFLAWNTGDLLGRLGPALPTLRLARRPRVLFALAVARAGFLPLYGLCNVGGRGAVVASDAFYLVGVQGLFGVSNGYLGSSCMMGFGEWVEADEAEAAGGFMSLCLVGGLAAGSLLSFSVAA